MYNYLKRYIYRARFDSIATQLFVSDKIPKCPLLATLGQTYFSWVWPSATVT